MFSSKIKPKCRKCNSNKHVIPIEYGLPTDEAIQNNTDENGNPKCIFGGCIHDSIFDPKWYCYACNDIVISRFNLKYRWRV